MRRLLFFLAISIQTTLANPTPDEQLAAYFKSETAKIADACLAEIKTADDWQTNRGRYREQLFEMLGIPSRRQRTELQAQVTGTQEHDGIRVENVVFQSLPGLYVTANFYRPAADPKEPLPAILYACGHSKQKALGVSFGNKTGYHHHGVWFAKNGYACLMIDTIQLGEIEGIHHGTYRHGRWWWNSRGYTPAGVEAWNGIRALDYLQSRPEVDAERIGMTGRSGGGAYTWWVAALDDRVKVAVPVAGITNLHNHVVDGVVEGHCDCMFHVNTYRWDFAQVAALVAPRPLLIANTDKDSIFPLDGVVEVHAKTKRIYELLGAGEKLGLAITEGPHKDTQALRTVAFEWFERHLKGKQRSDEFDPRAPQVLERRSLRVLKSIPEDEIVTSIDQSFVAKAPADQEVGLEAPKKQLREKVFRGWPVEPCDLNLKEVGEKGHYEFDSQTGVRLPLLIFPRAENKPEQSLILRPVDEAGWKVNRASRDDSGATIVVFPARGIGPTAWTDDPKKRTHLRRRFMLLGQTLDGMRVWDIRRAIAATCQIEGFEKAEITIEAEGKMATNALYASLFEEGITELRLKNLPETLQSPGAPDYLNILRYGDIPAAVTAAKKKSRVEMSEAE